MRKIEIATRIVVGAQVLLCVCAALFACSACQRMNLGWFGAAFYGTLLVALLRRWDAVANLSLCAAVSVHAALLVRMIGDGYTCGFCIGAAIGCVALVILRALQFHGLLRAIAVYMIPLSLVASTVLGWASPVPQVADLSKQIPADPEFGKRIMMVVFENPECPYCERFKREVLPLVQAIYGDTIAVTFTNADANPAVRVTPTILLARGDDRRVYEGLPSAQLLMREIQRLHAAAR
jgi:hypothetical protein